MKRLVALAMLALGTLLSATSAVAEDGCSPIGSWYGYYAPPNDVAPAWMSTIDGMSNNSGTMILELVTFDSTLGGWFPTAVAGGMIRGEWKRTSGNTFAVSAIGIGRDAQGNALYIGKMYGTDTLLAGCNVVQVDVTLEILDPVTFVSMTGPMPQATHYGYRIAVEP